MARPIIIKINEAFPNILQAIFFYMFSHAESMSFAAAQHKREEFIMKGFEKGTSRAMATLIPETKYVHSYT